MSSQGFYRGTSHDQVPFFANKEKQMIEGRKWPPDFDKDVDISKINMDVISTWITKRITELLGFEDDIVIDYCRQQLVPQSSSSEPSAATEKICPKKLQINLTGFLAKKSSSFVKDLWALLLSAQESELGIPEKFLEEQKNELSVKQAEAKLIKEALEKVHMKTTSPANAASVTSPVPTSDPPLSASSSSSVAASPPPSSSEQDLNNVKRSTAEESNIQPSPAEHRRRRRNGSSGSRRKSGSLSSTSRSRSSSSRSRRARHSSTYHASSRRRQRSFSSSSSRTLSPPRRRNGHYGGTSSTAAKDISPDRHRWRGSPDGTWNRQRGSDFRYGRQSGCDQRMGRSGRGGGQRNSPQSNPSNRLWFERIHDGRYNNGSRGRPVQQQISVQRRRSPIQISSNRQGGGGRSPLSRRRTASYSRSPRRRRSSSSASSKRDNISSHRRESSTSLRRPDVPSQHRRRGDNSSLSATRDDVSKSPDQRRSVSKSVTRKDASSPPMRLIVTKPSRRRDSSLSRNDDKISEMRRRDPYSKRRRSVSKSSYRSRGNSSLSNRRDSGHRRDSSLSPDRKTVAKPPPLRRCEESSVSPKRGRNISKSPHTRDRSSSSLRRDLSKPLRRRDPSNSLSRDESMTRRRHASISPKPRT